MREGHRRVEAPTGHAQLFGGEQGGPGLQSTTDRGLGVPDHELAGHAGEGDVRELACHIQRDHRRHASRGGVDGEYGQAVGRPGRHQQYVGLQGPRHAGDGAGEPAPGLDPDRRQFSVGGADREWHDEAGGPLPLGQQEQEVRLRLRLQQDGGRDDGAGEERHRRRRAAELLQHYGGLTGRRTRTAAVFGHQQAGEAEVDGQGLPQPAHEGPVAVVDRGHRGRVAVVGKQITHGGAQLVLDVGVEQIELAHRGSSFQGISLSPRGSAGRPRIRSAMMLRRISEVPPSMELPLARR